MTSPAVKLLGAKPSTAAFDPLGDISWYGAIWAEDPDQTPPSSGGAVTSWRNAGSDGGNWTDRGGTSPLWQSSVASFNSKPCFDFTNNGDPLVITLTSTALPVTYCIVALATDNNDRLAAAGGTNAQLIRKSSTWQLNNGTAADYGTSNSNANCHVVVWNGASSLARVNGTEYTSLSCGTNSPIVVGNIGANSVSTQWSNYVAFFGCYAGVLGSTSISDFETWASTHYGL